MPEISAEIQLRPTRIGFLVRPTDLASVRAIKEANAYYEDPFECVGRFDFVMANPPFNVDGVDKDRLAKDKRFPFGLPTPDNANYLWIELFYSALGPKGRAGFVMANSAADASLWSNGASTAQRSSIFIAQISAPQCPLVPLISPTRRNTLCAPGNIVE